MPLPTLYAKFKSLLNHLQPVVLLLVRLCFGYQFFLSGLGKLQHIDRTTEFFASLHIPMPQLNVYIAGSTECIGGLLLLFGLASRLISIPLVFTMLVALATQHRPAFISIFSPTPDPDSHQIDSLSERFRNAFDQAPVPFLLASLTILAFGPGCISLDALIKKFCCKSCNQGISIEQPSLTK